LTAWLYARGISFGQVLNFIFPLSLNGAKAVLTLAVICFLVALSASLTANHSETNKFGSSFLSSCDPPALYWSSSSSRH